MAPHLLQLLVVVLFSRGNAATPQSQIETLYALYNQTNGENWKWKNEALNGPIWSFNSLNQQDPCNTNNVPWQGITCSLSPNRCKTSTCYIEKIDLEFYRLVGYLPMDIYALTSLTRLVLQRNQLQGSIPSMVGLLTNMKIMQMSTNSFTGSIPSSIGSLFQLQYFSIDNNEITGSIPSSIGLLSQLESFYVSYNHITGSLPSSIGFLPKLLDFFVPYNLITGTIPSSYGSLSQLLDFSISSNVITGTLPSSLGSMSQLQTFSITSIAVTGSLPLSLGSLSQLQSLYINFNAITGFIPSTFGSLSQLQDLVLSDNRITGPIPSSLGNLTQLQIFDIHNNQITGSIPPILGSLFRLQYFYISGNDITGSIPSTLGSFFQLLYFSIADNHLTGSLPPTLGSFFRLQHFYISNNHITGSLPSSFGSFSQLQVFYCDSNQMTGSIPSSFGSLSQLIYFYISDNQITGSVPPSLGLLSQLQYFHIQNNYITGSLLLLPNNMTQLRQFHAQKNHLSSTISLQLCSFPELEQLFLQQNQFVGSLDMLVSCLIQSSSPLRLENLDVSGNQLSGSIPDPLFFSSLRSIALSVNCFEGELPRSVCTAGNIRTLSLDGLRSSRDCKTQSIVPFTKISIGSMMEGSIPDCIWNLLNLTTLHLSGNGFKGKIGERTLPISRLVDVSLSHNYLSGEIPNWLLSQPNMENLDLSHNKFTGDLDAIRKSWINQNIVRVNTTKALKLSVNRLSGRLPSMMKIYSTLDILSGNLFSCENLPKNDENYEYYVCGSSEYTQSMMLIGGLIGLFILLFLLYLLSVAVFMTISLTQKDETSTSSLTYVFARRIGMWISKLLEFYFKIINRLRQYFTLCLDKNLLLIKNKEIDNIYFLINNICRSLVEVDKLFLMTTTVMIMSSIPLYMMKNANNQSYVTHSHQYQWYFTIAYLSGILPGLLVLIICFISLWTFYLSLMYLKRRFTLHPSNKNNHEIKKNHDIEDQEFSSSLAVQDNSSAMTNQTNPTTSMNTHPSSSRMSLKFTTRGWIFLCLISFLNIGVVGTVNGLYVWSTLKNLSSLERLSIRLGVSLFGMLWKVIMRSILSTEVKTSLSGIWLLSLFGVINGVIIPCLATTFTSPSCYQRLIVAPQDISSSYSYSYCSSWLTLATYDARVCIQESIDTMEVLKSIPPFAYSYQCGSTLLTAYIPVYMFASCFQIIGNIFQIFPLIFQMKCPFLSNKYPPNLAWVIMNVIEKLILLLSFGLSSPVLGFTLCLSGVLNVSTFLMQLGKFILVHFTSQDVDETEIKNSERQDHTSTNTVEGLGLVIRKSQTNPITNEVDSVVVQGNLEDDGNPKNSENLLLEQLFMEYNVAVDNGLECIDKCKWLIITPSCLLLTLLCWDIAGNKVGWEGSYWIPILGLGMIIIFWLVDYFMPWRYKFQCEIVTSVWSKS